MSTGATTHGAVESHAVAHTYQPYRTGLPPSMLGLVLFLGSELALFGAFFMYYGYKRLLDNYDWPQPGMHIPADETGINTMILVASSFTAELALLSLMRRRRTGLSVWLVVTFILGAIFLALQAVEYGNLDFTPKDKAAGSIFYSLTGLHGAHVAIGLLLLLFCIVRAVRGHFSREEHQGLAASLLYWHFVDIVWILLYTVVYLLPGPGFPDG